MGGTDKVFAEVGGRPLVAHAVSALHGSPVVGSIVLVLAEANVERGQELVRKLGLAKVSAVVAGGPRRQDSVRRGLAALPECEYVAVHDGGRPLATAALVERGLELARESGAAVPARRPADTVKEAGADMVVERTLDRERLWACQTPQVFRRDLLERAHREVAADVTDDAAMVEALGEPVVLFEGERWNLKVTTPEDLEWVRWMAAGVTACE
jgi:2-C-methyl-D-erythritol 4-phosphate cytidylyltransferase